MSTPRAPHEAVLDVVLYAPIGVLASLRTELPKHVAAGRAQAENRVQLARMIGQMAVAYGRTELNKRIAERRAAVNEPAAQASPAPAVADPDPVVPNPAAPDPAAPPLDGYDAMPAARVVGMLASLSADVVDAVDRYERAHRARRTILGKIEQLRT